MDGVKHKTCRDCVRAQSAGRRGWCKCFTFGNVKRGWGWATHPVQHSCWQFADNGKGTIDGKPMRKDKK